jgi:GTP-binding protein
MKAKFLKSAVRAADVSTTDKPQIALAGRSNVGKSSLINHLAGVKTLARTSSTPGLTQTLNVYEFDNRFLLVDLPGYGYARPGRAEDGGFARMIGEYLSASEHLKLVLLVIDGRHGLTERDRYVFDQLTKQRLRFVVILNKIDKLSSSAAADALRKAKIAHPKATFITHSTVASKGLGEIREAIEQAMRA